MTDVGSQEGVQGDGYPGRERTGDAHHIIDVDQLLGDIDSGSGIGLCVSQDDFHISAQYAAAGMLPLWIGGP